MKTREDKNKEFDQMLEENKVEPKKNIYGIEQKYLELMNIIIDSDGEITPEIAESLVINKDDFKSKLNGYAAIVRLLRNRKAFAKERKDFYTNEEAKTDKRIDWIETTVNNAMVLFEVDEMELDDLGKINYRKSESTKVDYNLLPKAYYTKVAPKPFSKSELKTLLKEGKKIKGVSLVTNKNIQIK